MSRIRVNGALAGWPFSGRFRACVLAALMCASVPAWSSGKGVQADALSIPAAPLARALDALASQTGIELLYPPALVEGRRAPGVSGPMAPEQALRRLLAGSGIDAVHTAEGVFVLRERVARQPGHGAAAAPQLDEPAQVGAPQALHRVLVTGSRIPRVALEAITPVTVISREQIESGGFTTLFDLLRHQPGITGHHAVDAATEAVSQSLTSLVSTAVVQSASLYGLGPRGTLFLVDGRRVANYALPSTSLGGLSDLGAIPLSMVERVEILRGGASAVYGADAVAGVVNIILRRDYDGGEVETLYGRSMRGDAETWRVSAGAGFAVAGGQATLIADRLSQAGLPGTSRAWHTRDRRADGLADDTTLLGYYDRAAPTLLLPSAPCVAALDTSHPACRLDRERYRSLRPASESTALRLHWQRPLDADGASVLHASLRSARTDTRMGAAPMTLWNIPVPQDDVRHDVADALGHAFYDVGPIWSHNRATIVDATAGVRFPLGHWAMDAEISHSSHRVDNLVQGVVHQGAFLDAIASGDYRFDGRRNAPATLRGISPQLVTSGRSRMDTVTLRGAGTAGRWHGGQVRAAAGIEAVRDRLDYRPDPYFADPELAAPLKTGRARGHVRRTAAFGELEIPFGERLWLEVAGRLDRSLGRYSRFSPRFGLGWRPHARLLLRASVADAFRAPTLYETLGHPPPDDYYGLEIWVPAASVAPCATEAAGDCLLEVGVAANPMLGPERARTRNLGAAWSPRSGLDLAIDWFNVERRDEIAVASAVVDASIGLDSLVRDAQGRATQFASRYTNIGRTDVRGMHVEADWTPDPAAHRRWSLGVLGHYLTHVRSTAGGGGLVEQAGHLAPRFAAAASLRWRSPVWDLALHLRHFGGYRVHAADVACPQLHIAAGHCRNPSVNLLAAHVARDLGEQWRVSVQIDNLADRRPVNYDPMRTGYNGAIDDPIGRAYLLRVVRRF